MVTAYVIVLVDPGAELRLVEDALEEDEELLCAFCDDSAACVRRLALACAEPMLEAAPVVLVCLLVFFAWVGVAPLFFSS